MPDDAATYIKCPSCKEGRMVEKYWPWKGWMVPLLKCTLLLWPMALLLTSKPDWLECPKCGRKKVDMGMMK